MSVLGNSWLGRWLSGRAGAEDDARPERELVELREARARHQDNEERLRYALLGAGAGMWDWEIPTGGLLWDEPYYQLYGLDPKIPPSYENWIESILPEDREVAAAAVRQVLTQRRTEFQAEFRIRHPTAGVRWLTSMGYTKYAPDGTPVRMTGVTVDVTRRKNAEAALRASEERLRFALNGASAGMWDWDITTNRVVWDARTYELHGLDRAKPSNYENWLTCVHPDDHAAAQKSVADLLARKGVDYRFDYRVRHPTHGTRWLAGLGFATYAPDGTPLRMTGINLDITDRRRLESELQTSRDDLERRVAERTAELREAGRVIAESEERFRQVTTAIDQVFWLSTTDKNQILYISPAYERIWGRPTHTLLEAPRTWLEAIHPDDRERVIEAATTRQTAGTYDEEYRITRPDGTERWIRDRAFPITEPDGTITRLAGVADDITERKKLQHDMIAAIEHEQQRIGRDLHDSLCQILTGTQLKASLLAQQLATDPARAAAATAIEQLLHEAIEQARGLAYGMNPVIARPGGIIEALHQLAARTDTPTGPRTTARIPNDIEVPDPLVATQLHRIAQEAVQNALKHATAQTITIELTRDHPTLRLTITDDGTGFDTTRHHPGNGLHNMNTRAGTIAARLHITSTPATGTTVTCTLRT